MSKNKIIIVVIIALVIVCSGFAYFMITNESRYYKQLEKKLIEMGTDFYANFYYEQMKDHVELFQESGIPISLHSLSTYGLDITDFKNKKTGKACDENKTLAKIKFKEETKNYEKDFEVEPILVCE